MFNNEEDIWSSDDGGDDSIIKTSSRKAFKKVTSKKKIPVAKPKSDSKRNNFGVSKYHEEIKQIREEYGNIDIKSAREIYKKNKENQIIENQIIEPEEEINSSEFDDQLISLFKSINASTSKDIGILSEFKNPCMLISYKNYQSKDFKNYKSLIKGLNGFINVLHIQIDVNKHIDKSIYDSYISRFIHFVDPELRGLFKTFYDIRFGDNLTDAQIYTMLGNIRDFFYPSTVIKMIMVLNYIHEKNKGTVVKYDCFECP